MSNESTYNDYLAHYGVKGMKWGVRRDEALESVKARYQREKESRIATDEGKYLNKGLSAEEAHAKAVKKEQIRHRVKVVGGVAVTAAVAYVGTQEYKKRFQSVDLPMDTKLKNINKFGEDLNVDRRLYVTYKPGDSKKYRGAYAEQLRGQFALDPDSSAKRIFETTLTTTERIKAPSHHQAQKLYKEFRKKQLSEVAPEDLKFFENSPYFLPKDYKTFNRSLVGTGNKLTDGVNAGFYDFLKTKGYNSVLDANDQFISGYNTEKPLIVFNANSSAVKSGHRIVERTESIPLARITVAKAVGRETAKLGAKLGIAYGAHKKVERMSRNLRVKQYYQEHPNSKLTEAEVNALLDKEND